MSDNDLIRRGDALELFDAPFLGGVEDMIRALPAIAASQPADPARVTVKPLIWDADENGNYHAQSIRGCEAVYRWIKPQVIDDDRVTYQAWGIEAEFDTPEAAQAAIEAEIASEILAAIDVQPNPRDAQIAALVEAVEQYLAHDTYSLAPMRAAIAAVKGGDA